MLLDEGVPSKAAIFLKRNGVTATHVFGLGLQGQPDPQIIAAAIEAAAVVVTLDSDFHRWLAKQGAERPSVIRIREEGLRPEAMADLILLVLRAVAEPLRRGAAVSAVGDRVRVRRLPFGRG